MKRNISYHSAAILLLFCFLIQTSPAPAQSSVHFKNCNYLFDDFKVNFKGSITVADDDKSIKSISDGGFLEIEKRTFGNSRKLNIYPNSEGRIICEYWQGSKRMNFEPEGRIWMEEILPGIIRSTGIDIEGRVKRFYRKGGVKAVLNEIELIESDFISAKYFAVLIIQEKLTESEYKQAIHALPEMVSSDFEKSNVFLQVSNYYLGTNGLTESYLSAVSHISSDFEKAKVLKNMKIDDFNENQQNNYLITINGISSDFEKSNVIKYLLSKPILTENTFISTIRVSDHISSDFEKSACFVKMLTKSPNDKILTEIFRAVSNMSSDFEKGRVLKKAASNVKPSSSSIDAYFEAINSMSSDFESSSVLKSIIKANAEDEALYIKIINSAANLSSDFEKSGVLTCAASRMPRTEKVKEEYIKAAKTISSSFEFGNAMKAIY